jgi:hypothetical protein
MSDSLQVDMDLETSDVLLPQPYNINHLIHGHGAAADSLQRAARMIQWVIDPRTGDRIWAPSDTLLHNFQQTTVPDGFSVAMGHLAPIGSPSINKIFFDKWENSHFVFNNAYSPYFRKPTNNLFLNTRVPYARLNYQRSPFSFGTAGPEQEDRFDARLTSNFGQKLNVAVDIGILDARGFYTSQAVRHNNFGMSGNYLSDRFEAHGFFNIGTMTNAENGGITEDSLITHPESLGRNFTSRDVPVKFRNGNTWNRVKNDQFFFSGRYNLGYREGAIAADSLQEGHAGRFVPVASVSFTSHNTQQFRRFLSHDTTSVIFNGAPMQRIDTLYANRRQFLPNGRFLYNEAVDDSVRYTSFRNVIALSLREGFREWVQFGLTAFLEHDVRIYQTRSIDNPAERMSHREHAVTIGGVLNRQQSENLRFNIRADLGVLGANIGEFRAVGDIETGFNIAGRRTTLAAEAHIKNLRPMYLQENFHSKYFYWNKNLGDIRRVYMGGRLHIPFTNTTLSAGVENLQNFIYFDKDRNITQESSNIQVVSARADQRLRLGILNWDNQVVYQLSGNDEVIPLPTFALYTNMYLQFKIVNELTVQAGVDAHYHTSYYAPGYEPALLQFYNQRERKIGNYPISTLYANMHLKQTRFFLMFYNVASRVWTPVESCKLPNYPVNPFGFRVGVSINLHN